MSDTDSFIDEVNEEVRRDRLYGYLRKYGWVAALAIVAIVGAAGYNEYRQAQEVAKAQALGDAMLEALSRNDDVARAGALADVSAETPQGEAVLAFLTAGAQAEAGQTEEAAQTLQVVSGNGEVPLIYRQVAAFKALILQADTLDIEQRRAGFDALAVPGVRLRLLAEEQLALLDIEEGDTDAALTRFQAIMDDAEVTSGLQRRALQAMVALGGAPQATETADEG
ncbi:tetratricopeptide repeat protein [uncultured Tateyamaria sp.]|uniref:tetratricopeptide repeat protein n=1 Tax=uncultured Tateyamaria sp. TaxID=455651 RepID=UPI002622EA93|nr:tetratricopeptide repeat protein [uncultured Tateyamaria sp.]